MILRRLKIDKLTQQLSSILEQHLGAPQQTGLVKYCIHVLLKCSKSNLIYTGKKKKASGETSANATGHEEVRPLQHTLLQKL